MISRKAQFPIVVSHRGKEYVVRPLFVRSPEASHRRLKDALSSLEAQVRRKFSRTYVDRSNLHELLWYLFNPEVRFESFRLEFPLGQYAVSDYFTAAWFNLGEHNVIVLPDFDSLFFIARGREVGELRPSDVKEQAVAMIQHLHRKERKEAGRDLEVRDFVESHRGRKDDFCSVAEVQVNITGADYPFGQIDAEFLALFGLLEQFSGALEIEKVGHEMNLLYPQDLMRAHERESLVTRIRDLIFREENLSLVLVGPSGAGRTSILHEALHRHLSASDDKAFDRLQKIWHLDPARVVAGMNRIGMWQRRFSAVLDHARDRLSQLRPPVRGNDRLFFDNMVALFRVGQSSQNKMTLSDVLKPYLEKRSLQVIGEATPEEWKRIEEIDRRFADLFQVVRVPAMAEEEAVRVALRRRARLERDHDCSISLPAVSRVLDLQRAFRGSRALPGGMIDFLDQLAIKFRHGNVDVSEVNQEFETASRLRSRIFDRDIPLRTSEIRSALRHELVGQDEAVECLVDTVHLIKAGLADPERPFGAFLFIGPTGVGKTQAAKALARYLFGSTECLLRFDMNQYVDAGSVARLAGDFFSPEGQLTTRVRYQPFCVLLFDEIEKAHPSVLDLLLQVLGEGRLTDALGKTTDFTKTIIIMTSNIGSTVAGKGPGFGTVEEDAAATYAREVERFFRSEFLNRIDGVVVFRRLTLQQVQDIARLQIADLLQRDGFVRRSTILNVSGSALEDVARRGYDPEMGGRALKRLLESDLSRMAAEHLAGLQADTPIFFEILMVGGMLVPRIVVLREARAYRRRVITTLSNREDVLEAYEALIASLARAESAVDELLLSEAMDLESGDPKVFECLDLSARAADARRRLEEIVSQLKESRDFGRPVLSFKDHGTRLWKRYESGGYGMSSSPLRELYEAADVRKYMLDLYHRSAWLFDESRSRYAMEYVDAGCLMHGLESLVRGCVDAVCLQLHSCRDGDGADEIDYLVRAYRSVLGSDRCSVLPCLPDKGDDRFLFAEGAGFRELMAGEAGTHLFVRSHRTPALVQVRVLRVPPEQSHMEFTEIRRTETRKWRENLEKGEAEFADDPWPVGEVLRIYNVSPQEAAADDLVTDLRTGTIHTGPMKPEDWRLMLYQGLQQEAPPVLGGP